MAGIITKLTEAENKGCCDILGLLKEDDVISIAETMNKHTCEITSRSEAEKVILSTAKSADDLLNRKKITKAVLLEYIKKLSVDKDGLKAFIINHWNKQQCSRQLGLKSPEGPSSSNACSRRPSSGSPAPQGLKSPAGPSTPGFEQGLCQMLNVNLNISNTSGSDSQGASNHHSDTNQALADAEVDRKGRKPKKTKTEERK